MKKSDGSIIIMIGIIILTITLLGYLKFFRSQPQKKIVACLRLPTVTIRGRRPALAPSYRLQWDNNRILNVHFENGVNPRNRQIVAIANEWSKYCGISFQIVRDDTDSQIRVSFSKGLASAVGIECLQYEYRNKPTMYLESLDTLRNQQTLKRIVLHEFGHALGVEHELRKPDAHIPWDTLEVYRYYKTHFKWDKAEVDKNLFEPLEPAEKPYSNFDRNSIMVYAVEPPLTRDDFRIPWPTGLNDEDKKGIAEWYPKR